MAENDAEKQALIERVNLMRQVRAQRAAQGGSDPEQPGVQAIGSNASPGSAPQSPDWVDKLSNFVTSTMEANKNKERSYNRKQFGGDPRDDLENSHGLGDAAMSALDYPLAVGNRLEDMGAPGLGLGVNVPFTNGKRVTVKDLANLTGRTVGADLLGRGLTGLGEYGYDSAFKNIDKKLAAEGKAPISKLLREEEGAPVGTTKSLAKKAADMGEKALKERTEAYDKVTQAGVQPDASVPAPAAEKVLARMRRDPNLADQADKLEEHLNRYKKMGQVPIDQMSEWKSNLANSVPDTGNPTWENQYREALAKDFRGRIVDTGEGVEPGLGKTIDKTNKIMGSTLESEKPFTQQISRETTPNIITPVKAAMFHYSPQAAAAMYAAELSKMPLVRTALGKTLMQARPVTISNALKKQFNPWGQNGEDEKN